MISALEFVLKTREVAGREAGRVYVAPPVQRKVKYAIPDTTCTCSAVCVYWHEDCPSCLFGHVFNELGIDESALEDWKPRLRIVLRSLAVRGLIEEMPPQWCMWAGYIQLKQDAGEPWAKCVDAADDEYPGVPKS